MLEKFNKISVCEGETYKTKKKTLSNYDSMFVTFKCGGGGKVNLLTEREILCLKVSKWANILGHIQKVTGNLGMEVVFELKYPWMLSESEASKLILLPYLT